MGLLLVYFLNPFDVYGLFNIFLEACLLYGLTHPPHDVLPNVL